jgi:integrase
LPFRATPDLRQSTLKKDAAQGGGGDTDSPRSETQTDEGIRAFTQLDDEAEKKLLAGAAACNWRKRSLQLFRDIIVLMRDTGMRNERELYRMRIENLDWENRVIFVPDTKTEEGRRCVPMSNRVFDVLKQRCGEKREGWVFPSKRAASAHLTTMAKRFREARVKAGLPEDLAPYCGRHDYGTRILKRTGNLAAVMRTMGHKDVKTAMQYQHP